MMIPIIQPTLMKKPIKTKNKLVKTTSKSKVTKVSKKPKISISVVLKKDVEKKKVFDTKKEKTPKLKKISDIVVPRSNIVPKAVTDPNESDEITLVDENEPKKRRRGRNKKEKIYFSKATEEAIVLYNKEEDVNIRNNIYENKIRYSFEKLVENIFNTFKFTYFDNSPLEIQRETVSHLVINMHKFQAGKGKAFSYFSIVAKNYLIFHNNTNYKRFNQHVDISETPGESSVCLQTEDAHHKNVQTQELMKLLMNYWEKNISKIFNKEKDLNIAYAVIELFRGCDRLETFNKKTLYLYIREISGCKTQQVTKVINKMKSYQSFIMQNYLNRGFI
jgi:hypothetical protein